MTMGRAVSYRSAGPARTAPALYNQRSLVSRPATSPKKTTDEINIVAPQNPLLHFAHASPASPMASQAETDPHRNGTPAGQPDESRGMPGTIRDPKNTVIPISPTPTTRHQNRIVSIAFPAVRSCLQRIRLIKAPTRIRAVQTYVIENSMGSARELLLLIRYILPSCLKPAYLYTIGR